MKTTVYLIPGFFSPRWMLMPLARQLRKHQPHVIAWDYPRVFADPRVNVDDLLALFEADCRRGRRLIVITHSFGDWLGRSALQNIPPASQAHLISLSPVVAPVPAARLLHPLTKDAVPEIRVMADPIEAAHGLDLRPEISHTVLWSRWDSWVRRPHPWPGPARSHHEIITGTHNSILFQPNLWRRLREILQSEHVDPKTPT